MKELINELLLKNRTIVSSDNRTCMELIKDNYEIQVHSYPSGIDYQTWIIPPEWNPIKGELIVDGSIIASYEESPLFIARYSLPFSGIVTKNELLEHTFTFKDHPEAYGYEFRLAYNFQRRLKEWRISVPFSRLEKISEDSKIEVNIQTDVKPGNMLIGESTIEGTSGYSFAMLSHYCHVAQANDGLAGVVVMLETVKRIREKYPNPRYTYTALVMPETIGSNVFASENLNRLDNMIGGVFSEMGGAESPIQFVFSRRGDTYIDRIFTYVLKSKKKLPCRMIPFKTGWGNDELVFDSPGLGVPVVSLDRFPFEAYHTHFDNMDLVNEESLEEIVDILVSVADLLERDFIPVPKSRIPVYLTRYNLYADWTYDRKQYDINAKLIENLWSGLSIFDICMKFDLDFDLAFNYIIKFIDLNLIEKSNLTPDYSRETRFVTNLFEEHL
jgi:aminopeptidase-like protein